MKDVTDNFIDMRTLKNNNKTIKLTGNLTKLSLKKLFLLSPFKVGDVLIDKKGKRLLVSKVNLKNIFVNGSPYKEGGSITLQDEDLKIYTFSI
jgi:hypothetical protein